MYSQPKHEYAFSNASIHHLKTCRVLLQKVFIEVIKGFDCSVIEGYRNMEEQEIYYEQGLTNVNWPLSKHNKYPSEAIHVVPYPIDWEDYDRFFYFGGFVKGIAQQMGIGITWGGDWNSNNVFTDQALNDYVHFELISAN